MDRGLLNFLDTRRAAALRGAGEQSRNVRPRAESWLAPLLRRACAVSGESAEIGTLERELLSAGATNASDFRGISVEEACIIWAPLQRWPVTFVRQFLAICSQTNNCFAKAAVGPVQANPLPAAIPKVASTCAVQYADKQRKAMAALAVCTMARHSAQLPPPAVLADAIVAMAAVDTLLLAPPEQTPRAEATRRSESTTEVSFEREAIWIEFCGWKASAGGYASALRLYGQSCSLHRFDPWPPSDAKVDAFVVLFRSASSLGKYLSHLRTILRWTRAPLGALLDTGRVVRGAEKSGRAIRRLKVRATADQTRRLAQWCHKNGHEEIGDSWVVARHYCLRYGEVLQIGQPRARAVLEATAGGAEAIRITFTNRKCCSEPVEVSRRCICSLQGRTLCGTCVLKRRLADSSIPFSGISYNESLACLKLAAQSLGFAEARSWGTHAFRRGWATEVVQANGPAALFYSGGWRGVTAFAYASAKARGTLAEAEFLIEFSDSSGED